LLPPAFYVCLLDQAPCFGNNRHDGSYEWGNEDRIYVGPNVSGQQYQIESAGMDYMLYFNLFVLANPTYLNTYKIIQPQELCPETISKQNYTEHDVKNFLASNIIKAGNLGSGDYLIQND